MTTKPSDFGPVIRFTVGPLYDRMEVYGDGRVKFVPTYALPEWWP